MTDLYIKHVSKVDSGAFGVMMGEDRIPFALTLERTYLVNGIQTTKIPTNTKLRCKKSFYNKGGYPTFEIIVAFHKDIKFHKANKEMQLDGCIAVGEEFGILDNDPAILHCGNGGGFDEFMGKYGDLDSFYLTIEE